MLAWKWRIESGGRQRSAQAERRQTSLRSPVLHGVQERRENACPAGADGMSERDRATVDIDALPVPAELFAVGCGFAAMVVACLRLN